MQKWASRSGFTIIELIVVIVVIAILVAISVVSYANIQQRSRDSQRTSDITQIKIAIDKYHVDNAIYPPACPTDNAACDASNLASYLSPYLKDIPTDPINSGTQKYFYIRGAETENSYAVRVNYEAKPQCKTGVRVNTSWWSSTIPVCS